MSSIPESGRGGKGYVWVLVLTLAAALAIYQQTTSFEFAGYDDKIITRDGDSAGRGLSAESLGRIFVPRSMSTYQPLRDLAVEAVYEFSGTDPSGYHWFNLVMFLVNLAAVFWLLRKLLPFFGAAWPGGVKLWAAAGAAWFAVHPLHVESVAWMNSNKELLSGLFYFLALGFYIDSRGKSVVSPRYLASWLCFLLGLLAKPSGAAFPLIVAALELSRLGSGRFERSLLYRLGPYLLLSLLAGLYFIFRSTTGTGVWLQDSVLVHSLSMASVLGKYIIAMLLPVNLSHSYPPPFFFGEYDWRLALYLLLDFALIAAAVVAYRRGERLAAFGILFFLLNLLPVSGLVPIAIFRADRYLYIPSLGLMVTGLALARYLYLAAGTRRLCNVLAGGAALALVMLGLMAHHRCRDWRDSITLWKSAVRTHGNFQYNYYGLGGAYYKADMWRQSLQAYRNASRFKDNFMCHYMLAAVFDKLGEADSARTHLEAAERLFTPDMTPQMNEMTDVYRRLGQRDKLIAHLARWGAMRIDEPEFVGKVALELARAGADGEAVKLIAGAGKRMREPGGYYLEMIRNMLGAGAYRSASGVLGLADSAGGDPAAIKLFAADLAFAAGYWDRAVAAYSSIGIQQLDPGRRERLAAACLRSGRAARALQLFRDLAESVDTPQPAQLNNIGAVLEAMDSLEAAEGYFRSAVELDSTYADGWFNLGRVLSAQGRYQEALDSYLNAGRLEGRRLDTGMAVAGLLARLGRSEEAWAKYERLLELAPSNRELLLETADYGWEIGRKEAAGEYYARLKSMAGEDSVPARVNSRAN